MIYMPGYNDVVAPNVSWILRLNTLPESSYCEVSDRLQYLKQRHRRNLARKSSMLQRLTTTQSTRARTLVYNAVALACNLNNAHRYDTFYQ